MIIATDDEPLRPIFYVRFYPALQKLFGSKHVPIIVDRLEYWFHNKKFKQGFFKFLEPCSHYLYKPGDSWEEEVGICRKAFNAAFNLIGVSYDSKTAYLAEEDPFKGKLYARYYDRKTNQMFFVRNHAFAEEFFKSLFKRKTKISVSKPAKNQAAITEQKGREKENHYGRSRNGHNDRSCKGPYIDKQITTNISFPERTAGDPIRTSETDPKPEEDMHKIWIEEIGEQKTLALTPSLSRQMRVLFQQRFSSSLENWRHYCRKIASSKFLMGEAPNTRFKAWLWWAIKPEAIDRIEAGGFTLGDRALTSVKQPQMNFEELAQQSISSQVTSEAQTFHQSVLQELGASKYYHWFRHVKLEQGRGDNIHLLVPRLLEKSYLQQHYMAVIEDALKTTFKTLPSFEIIVSEQAK
jgi:hypothetical protein